MILSEREVHSHWLLDGSQSDPDVRSAKNDAFLFYFSTFLRFMEKMVLKLRKRLIIKLKRYFFLFAAILVLSRLHMGDVRAVKRRILILRIPTQLYLT